MKTGKIVNAVLLLMAMTASSLQAQISIAAARAMPVGSTVTISGIVTNGSELGVIRYLQDSTGGLPAYSSSMSAVQRGDSITVTGVTKLWSNLLELDPVTSFTVHSSNHPSPTPLLIPTNGMGPSNEAELVTMHNVQFQNPGGVFSGNTNYNIIGGGQTAEIRINLASNLVGKPIPVGQVNLIGLTSLYYSTYQLLLRDTNDIIPLSAIAMTSPVMQTNIGTTGFDLNWTTDVAGSTELRYGLTPSLELGVLTGTGGSTNHSVSVSGLTAATIIYAQAYSVYNADTAFSGLRAYSTRSMSSGDIKVYFTRTVDTTYATYQNAYQADDALDDTLIAYINRAQHSIDLAIYNFNVTGISNIVTALNNAHNNRGVKVRVIHDGSNTNSAIAQLSGIYSLASPTAAQYGIMHNKFVVFDAFSSNPDEAIVWMGSMNFTQDGINQYANNVVIFTDQSLAKTYTIEFEEMWGDTGAIPNSGNARFGPDKRDNTPHEFIIGGLRVECYFSPSDGVNEIIKSNIATAEHELMVETMLITRSDVAYAIRDVHNLGVETRVIINDTGECSALVNATLMSALGPYYREYGESYIMHNKLMAADYNHPGSDPLVLTGSHNWSNSADQRNDENTVIIHDSIIPNMYFQEFMARYALGVILTGIDSPMRADKHVNVFPNPAEEYTSIQFANAPQGHVSVNILDLSGRLVKSLTYEGDGNRILFEIPTIHLVHGLYLINYEADGRKGTKKIIVR